ncbi:MAG: 4Fe-4S binding protein [Bacteroidales bacterium]|nr:4Fe-4S binding protein [Bacteroidales bacterium]
MALENVLFKGQNLQEPEKIKRVSSLRRDNVTRPAIFIGAGTCGLGAGAAKTLEAVKNYMKSKSIQADVIEVGCIGLCAMEPLLDIQLPGKNRICFKNVTADKVEPLLDKSFSHKISPKEAIFQFKNKDLEIWKDVPFYDEHPFFARQIRWVLPNCGIIDPASIDEYVARGGYSSFIKALHSMTSEEVCKQVIDSGLRGRGGGGFLTGQKWQFARFSNGDQKYLICNADEGDPGAFMDRAVIEGDPHRLVEGMALAAYAIGATKAYIYIRAEYPLAIKRLKKALEDAKNCGLLGEDIMGSGFSLKMIIKMGAGAFVCGEETALMHSIEGKRGMPTPRPPFPTTSGLFEKPTVINNVETLSNVPNIIQNGPAAFNKLGTETSKGTKVFALSGNIALTGLVEIPMGTTIRDIIFSIGGGIANNKKFKAVQIGGPSGGCITDVNLDIQIDYESLKKVGAMMGSGGLVVMDENTCMVDIAKFFMDFIQRESCGKCIPCREGTRRMLEILQSITSKPHNKYEALDRFKGVIMLEKLAHVIKDTSLCGLGQSAPNPVLSTLRWFKEEYEMHVFERECPAGVCQEMKIYKIDVDKCTGCTACAKKCPTGAIIGSAKAPHFIVEDKCIACGSCLSTCKFDAIIVE